MLPSGNGFWPVLMLEVCLFFSLITEFQSLDSELMVSMESTYFAFVRKEVISLILYVNYCSFKTANLV